ncbi:transcription factor HES-4-B-like [Oppia nitens]|uniref:transcription factor HES-4-B-like n=1 Tax=Oppia nitens TaxID=1686743 RepID=UPI0023D9A594|nr:transcription factor HES-4-B-like [Oppia nitens]
MIKYFDDQTDCQANSYQRLTKPLIEKRRRARINLCLMQLKEMVIDSGRHYIQNPKCKYEKADILELTVEYLQNMHFKQKTETNETKQSFNAGFNECLKQVQHFLKCLPLSDKINNANNKNSTQSTSADNSSTAAVEQRQLISEKLLSHLDFCRTELTHSDVYEDLPPSQPRPEHSMDIQNSHNLNNERYYDQNILNSQPNGFSVIHHTRDYSSSISSTSSNSSTRTVSPPMSPEPIRHRPTTANSHSLSTSPQLPSDFIPEFRGLRANSLGQYEHNGRCYELGADGVWRPW